MDRRLIAMRLAVWVLASFAIACGFGADPSSDGTGDTGNGTGVTDSTGGDAQACGEAPHSFLGATGECYCDPGTTWVEPFNPSSFACAELEPRAWGPCPSGDSECECGADVRVPDYCSATDNAVATSAEAPFGCGFEEIFACACPEVSAETGSDGAEAVQCACPSVYTCKCPEYQRWCAFEPGLNNVECCYDAAQDPDGTHVPADETTTGVDASSSDDGSTGAASSSTTSSSTTSSGTGASETTG